MIETDESEGKTMRYKKRDCFRIDVHGIARKCDKMRKGQHRKMSYHQHTNKHSEFHIEMVIVAVCIRPIRLQTYRFQSFPSG